MEFKVVVDAGHGSIDTGTSYGNYLEKNINLEIARHLAQELKKVNIIPIMTRTEDKLYRDSRNQDIKRRPQIANENNADLFISIHANNYASSQPKGSQIFYKKNSEKSKLLAEYIKEELIKIRDANDRSSQMGDFYVLNVLNCPGILIETGFLSNAEDRQMLSDPTYQKKMAQSITQGVVSYFQESFAKEQDSLPSMGRIKENITGNIEEKNLLYYINQTDNQLHLFQSKFSFPVSNFFAEKNSLLSFSEIMALSALEELSKAPEGLISPLPAETKINSVKIDKNRVAVIDLSDEVSEYFIGGAGLELLSVNAIKNTLFSIEGIEGIKFLIEGKENQSIGGHIIFNQIYYE
ncbi:MAG: N-acetylmuramoyl-L-alanine amidase [bacterium]